MKCIEDLDLQLQPFLKSVKNCSHLPLLSTLCDGRETPSKSIARCNVDVKTETDPCHSPDHSR